MTDQEIISHLNSISDLLVAIQVGTGRQLNITYNNNYGEQTAYGVSEPIRGHPCYGFGPTPHLAYEALEAKRNLAAAEAEIRARHEVELKAELAALSHKG